MKTEYKKLKMFEDEPDDKDWSQDFLLIIIIVLPIVLAIMKIYYG